MLIHSVRAAAGLGNPPEKFYTNASESINNVLKLKTNRKKQSLTDFVDDIQELVLVYEKNMEKAFDCRGDWHLTNELIYAVGEKKHTRVLKQVKEASCSHSQLKPFDTKGKCPLCVKRSWLF